jgi:hypothetical protein
MLSGRPATYLALSLTFTAAVAIGLSDPVHAGSKSASGTLASQGARAAAVSSVSFARRKKKMRRRRGCNAYCAQAGPSQGGDPIVGFNVLRKAVRPRSRQLALDDNSVRVPVTCHLTHRMERLLRGARVRKGCRGAIYVADWFYADRHHIVDTRLQYLVFARANVAVPAGRTRTIRIPLWAREARDVRGHCMVSATLGIELKGSIYIRDGRHRLLDRNSHTDFYSNYVVLRAKSQCHEECPDTHGGTTIRAKRVRCATARRVIRRYTWRTNRIQCVSVRPCRVKGFRCRLPGSRWAYRTRCVRGRRLISFVEVPY